MIGHCDWCKRIGPLYVDAFREVGPELREDYLCEHCVKSSPLPRACALPPQPQPSKRVENATTCRYCGYTDPRVSHGECLRCIVEGKRHERAEDAGEGET